MILDGIKLMDFEQEREKKEREREKEKNQRKTHAIERITIPFYLWIE